MPDWNTYAILNLIGALALLALAAVVFLTRPAGRENRRLSSFIALWAGLVFAVAAGYFSTTPRTLAAWSGVTMAFWFASVPALLRFLAVLPSPLSKPLGHPIPDRLLLILIFAAPLSWFFLSEAFLAGVVRFEPWVPWRPLWLAPFDVFAMTHVGVVTYSIFVALSAFLRSPRHSARRRQMAAYALAAVAADVLTVLRQVLLVPHVARTVREGAVLTLSEWEISLYLVHNMVTASVFVVLMAYGIFAVQVFDIDLRLKAGIARGTVASIFVAAFFAVSEFVSGALSERWGLAAGVGTTAFLVFLIAPLQRLGERVSEAAMPHVHDTPIYRRQRKEEVYRGALESLLSDGVISAKERATLLRMQQDLGIEAARANQLEADVLRALGAA